MWIEPMLSERSTFTFIVMPLRFATRLSLSTISYRKGAIEIVASGVSAPGRVRKYMRIGTDVEARKPSRNSPYLIASRASRQPRALSLKVRFFCLMANFTRGE